MNSETYSKWQEGANKGKFEGFRVHRQAEDREGALIKPQSKYFTRDETGLVCLAHSAEAYTAILQVMVNVMKGGARAPPPSPAWANFTLMIECLPESSRCYSVYSVD